MFISFIGLDGSSIGEKAVNSTRIGTVFDPSLSDPPRFSGESAASRSLHALSDKELLEWFVRRHEEAAFAEIAKRHGPLVLGICRRVLRRSHDAEDAF